MIFTIQPVTKEQAEKLRASLVAHGSSCAVDVVSDEEINYVINGHGIVGTAILAVDSLVVNIEKKPFYVTQEMIESGIKEALEVTEKSAEIVKE